jgi:hypothetical protein
LLATLDLMCGKFFWANFLISICVNIGERRRITKVFHPIALMHPFTYPLARQKELEPSWDRCPQAQADGAVSLVLPEADELNISALDRAALEVSFPALREAVSRHFAKAGKKTPPGSRAAEARIGAAGTGQRLSGGRGNWAL